VARFRHVMVGLKRTQRDTDLSRYASMLARLDTAVEVRFQCGERVIVFHGIRVRQSL
jgi:hypothetical protein